MALPGGVSSLAQQALKKRGVQQQAAPLSSGRPQPAPMQTQAVGPTPSISASQQAPMQPKTNPLNSAGPGALADQKFGGTLADKAQQVGLAEAPQPEAEEPKSEMDQLYEDLLKRHEDSWSNIEQMQQANSAAMQRRAQAMQGAMGRSVAGGFAGAIGQAFLGGQQQMLQARQAHEQQYQNLAMQMLGRKEERERYEQGRQDRLDSEERQLIAQLAADGWSAQQIADYLGVDVSEIGGAGKVGDIEELNQQLADAEDALRNLTAAGAPPDLIKNAQERVRELKAQQSGESYSANYKSGGKAYSEVEARARMSAPAFAKVNVSRG